METQKNNPLHGITLEQILVDLHAYYGWEKLGKEINIKCFKENPSIKSSLKFLRKTPWARTKVEVLLQDFKKKSIPSVYDRFIIFQMKYLRTKFRCLTTIYLDLNFNCKP